MQYAPRAPHNINTPMVTLISVHAHLHLILITIIHLHRLSYCELKKFQRIAAFAYTPVSSNSNCLIFLFAAGDAGYGSEGGMRFDGYDVCTGVQRRRRGPDTTESRRTGERVFPGKRVRQRRGRHGRIVAVNGADVARAAAGRRR